MSTNNPTPSSNRWGTAFSILLSPFLWTALAGIAFVIYSLWPEAPEGASGSTPADTSAGVDQAETVWESGLELVINYLFLGLVILAIVTFVVGAAVGAKQILKDGTSVWPKRFFYITMFVAFGALVVFLFQKYIGPDATEGLSILAEQTRQEVARPFVEVYREGGTPENWSLNNLPWMDIILIGLIILTLVWMFWSDKKESKK